MCRRESWFRGAFNESRWSPTFLIVLLSHQKTADTIGYELLAQQTPSQPS